MDKIDQAFKQINRTFFLPQDVRDKTGIDAPLPIGYGQTNSQPTTVRFMLKWLDPQANEKILDVGSGSGWSTALLAHMIKPKGIVFAVEKIPALVKFGKENCKRAGISNVRFFQSGATYGLPEFAPYDRILVSAAAPNLPPELVEQLKVGGRIVIPVKNSIYVIDKTGKNKLESTEHPGFVFVPLL